ncbi:hypothetical protein EHE22_11565 [Ochrobactrum pseudogrignonense]|uniref:Uncharacterized protein n=1 Tax=Brucella pseudogrignonensis TaxID=419475 RepID=A0A7Y3T4U5_9HYPH|nr:hypothetical protein [Brucella pseudogrignonensis]
MCETTACFCQTWFCLPNSLFKRIPSESRFTLFGMHSISSRILSKNRFALFGMHSISSRILSKNCFALFGMRLSLPPSYGSYARKTNKSCFDFLINSG